MRTFALAAAALALGGALASNASAATEPADATTLSVGYIPALSQAPPFLADGLGLMAEEGLEIEWEAIASIGDALLLLAQGDLDAYVGAPSAPIFNSVSTGLDVRMVASLGSIATPQEFEAASGVLARQDLLDSGEISGPADLRGRKIAAVGPIGSATSFLISRVLAEGDVTLDEVELVTLPMAESLTALSTGAVDAAFLSSPFTTQAIADGIGSPVVDAKVAYGDVITAAIVMGPSMLVEDRDSAEAFLRASMRAAERLTGDYRTDDEVVTILAEFLGVDPEVVETSPLYVFEPTLAPHVPTALDMQDVFLAIPDTLGYTEPLAEDDLFDVELQQAAAESVGSTE